jgi:hypothetical protein
MPDMVSLQEQSRRSFFQWHILLIMKKKQLQATLADAGYRPEKVREIEADVPPVVDSDELALLRRFGLPIPEDLSAYDLPNPVPVTGIRFFFRAAPALDHEQDFVLDFVRQLANGSYEQRELIRVSYDDHAYLAKAAEKFNEGLAAYALQLVLNAAIIWAHFHGAVIMDWVSISARLLGATASSAHNGDWFQNLPDPDIQKPNYKKQPRIKLHGRTSVFGD